MRTKWLLPSLAGWLLCVMSAVPPALLAQAETTESSPSPQADCVPARTLPDDDVIVIPGIHQSPGSAQSFVAYFRVQAEQEASYRFRATALVDNSSFGSIPESAISFDPATVTLTPGQFEEVKVTVSNVTNPGRYLGTLRMLQSGAAKDCFRERSLELDLMVPDQVTVADVDQSITINTARKTFLVQLLPQKVRQDGLAVQVNNAGPTSVRFRDFSLALKGRQTQETIGKEDVIWENPNVEITPGGNALLRFRFADSMHAALPADEFAGSIRLHLRHSQESLTVPVTIFAKTGVWGAILALVIGIGLGRMLKSVNAGQDQIQLMERYVPMRAKVDEISDPKAKAVLRKSLDDLEKKIDKVSTPADREQLEAAVEKLEQKIGQMHQLNTKVHQLMAEFRRKRVPDNSVKSVEAEVNKLRDAILDEQSAAIQKGMVAVETLAKEAFAKGRRSRGGLGQEISEETGEPLPVEPDEQEQQMADMSSLDALIDASREEDQQAASFWARAETWFFKIMNWMTGVRVTARVRYGFFRPLVTLVAFIVILMLGFQEIYIEGGQTFGSNGLYDHLKLFLWGAVSDVFSRSLTSDDASITSFIAKK